MPPAPSTWTELSMQALGGNGVCASLGAPPGPSPPPLVTGALAAPSLKLCCLVSITASMCVLPASLGCSRWSL